METADELAVAAITWYELGWLAAHGGITLTIPVRAWLSRLARDVRTLAITPAVAGTAVSLPATLPGDPVDRLIYATAIEHGLQLVSKESRLRTYPAPRPVVIW